MYAARPPARFCSGRFAIERSTLDRIRWGSALAVMRAARFSPRVVFGSWRVLVALTAIFAPGSALEPASTLSHRFGGVS
jgi:hypothetical protein